MTTCSDDTTLRRIYGSWSRNLHEWCSSQLGKDVDCFVHFGQDWTFSVYSGRAEMEVSETSGIPKMVRPAGERSFTVTLPRGRDNPSEDQINEIFRQICIGAALVMEIDLSKIKAQLP